MATLAVKGLTYLNHYKTATSNITIRQNYACILQTNDSRLLIYA